jgi:hypothetical protein
MKFSLEARLTFIYSHPDTVKLTEGQTAEQAAAYFIELTKAYKTLTDEVVRKNFLEYGHPDGKQSVEVGLALPAWVVDAHNNIWVLGMYGIVIGGVLPYIVVSSGLIYHIVRLIFGMTRANGGSGHGRAQRMVSRRTLLRYSSRTSRRRAHLQV